MSAAAAPQGLIPVYHPSGDIRLAEGVDAIASGYNTNIFTNTPIKRHTDGTLIVTATGADSMIGVFKGCEYSKTGRRIVSAYWPANETYDAGSLVAHWTEDREIVYEGQGVGSYAATAIGETVNVQTASGGSTYTGRSNQSLSAAAGVGPGTLTIVGLAEQPDNAWGDAFTKVRVKIQTYQGPVA